jgi:predicted transcriptional regulator
MDHRKNEIEHVSIKLPVKLKTRLQKLGKLKQRSAHWLMKEAIEHYLDTEEELEKLKQKTLSRWQEAEKGQVVANNEVISWLNTWGTEQEQERPECK